MHFSFFALLQVNAAHVLRRTDARPGKKLSYPEVAERSVTAVGASRKWAKVAR